MAESSPPLESFFGRSSAGIRAVADTAPVSARSVVPALRAILTVTSGPDAGRILSIPDGAAMTIGRDPGCSVQLDDVGMSRIHARVVLYKNQCALCDLESRNGVIVNGVTMRPGAITPLAQGDFIRMGAHTTLRFSLVDAVEEQGLKQAYESSVRDWLTQLYNGRFFRKLLQREWESFLRGEQDVCVALFDLDHFKEVNDEHGHGAGDMLLRAVAEALQSGVRAYDAAARLGGEEFAVLFRGAELAAARDATLRLHAAIGALRVPWEASHLSVTVSAGVASSKETADCTEVERLVELADARMYVAKRSGRDRVVAG